MKTFCINLKRSKDRKSYINEIFEDVALPKPQFIQAIDYTTNNISPAEACFTSHQLAWQRATKEKAPVLIIEDDVVLHPAFETHLKQLVAQAIEVEVNVVFLGFQLKEMPKFTSVSEKLRVVEVKPVYFNGAYGYIVLPGSAKILLDLSKAGVNNFPDLWMAEKINSEEISAAFAKMPLITHGSFTSTLNHNG